MDIITGSFLILVLYGVLLFFISIYYKDNGVADIGWGPGFVVVAWYGMLMSNDHPFRMLLALVVTVWGVRLGLRILLRKRLRKGEDSRYKKWRDEWGKLFLVRSYFQIYLLQPALLYINAIVIVLFFASDKIHVSAVSYAGIALWLIGFSLECIADFQIDKFYKHRSQAGKQFIDTGLWRYSRHPNYFGEITLWWGLYIFTAPTVGWFLALISPLIITFLILFVSGIPMAEERRKNDPEFMKYMKRTSVIFPLPPKEKL